MTSSTNTQLLVFTDLDGTLIDHDTYSWEGAKQAVGKLKDLEIPIIPCTSKTRAEIEIHRLKIGLKDPFVSENGGGIFVPPDYFDFSFDFTKKTGDYYVIEFGADYKELRDTLSEIRREVRGKLIGFGDMSAKEVAEDTGLELGDALLAKTREYDEAFIFEGDEEKLKKSIESRGFNWTKGGRYWHVMGDNDKGKAVEVLRKLFLKKYKSVKTIGIGDSLNDLPMLRAVDIPILVQKKDGSYDNKIDIPNLVRADGIGPVGWNRTILNLLSKRSF